MGCAIIEGEGGDMGRRYLAEGGFRQNHPVLIETDEGKVMMLRHHVEHSPGGHAWGYGGSGPADLSKDLLWDVLGEQPAREMARQFLIDVISNIPQDQGWQLAEKDVRKWVDAFETGRR
jgi:hypothetical protein